MIRNTTIATSLVLGLLLVPTPVQAQSQPISDVLITELQTSNKTASEEFIEFYNTTDHDIDFADLAHQGKNIWKIQFFSSTKVSMTGFNWDPKTSGLITISLTRTDNTPVVIAAHGYFLLAVVGYNPGKVEPDLTYPSGHMSDSGGGVQLVDTSASGTGLSINTHSHLGWFSPTTNSPLSAGFYLTPSPGSSLQRTLISDEYTITSNTVQYIISGAITPKEAWLAPIELQPAPAVEVPVGDLSVDQPPQELQPAPEQLLPIQITELFPNPSSPQADDKDEYIELFNPNAKIVSLNGYSLQTGLKFSYTYTIQNLSIEPQSYLGLKSSETHIPLANSGGRARLLNSLGQVVSQTSAYDAAIEGQAWALQDDTWHWTTTPTLAVKNNFTQPTINGSPSKVAVSKTPKTSLPKAPTTKAVTVLKNKTVAVKAAKASKPSALSKNSLYSPIKSGAASMHMAILVGVGLAAVIYGLYEYRKDIANKFYQLRRNRASRRASRRAT